MPQNAPESKDSVHRLFPHSNNFHLQLVATSPEIHIQIYGMHIKQDLKLFLHARGAVLFIYSRNVSSLVTRYQLPCPTVKLKQKTLNNNIYFSFIFKRAESLCCFVWTVWTKARLFSRLFWMFAAGVWCRCEVNRLLFITVFYHRVKLFKEQRKRNIVVNLSVQMAPRRSMSCNDIVSSDTISQ